MENQSKKPEGFLRLKEILELLKISKSKWCRGVEEGIYPKGIKLGARTRVWSIASIRQLIKAIEEGKHEQ